VVRPGNLVEQWRVLNACVDAGKVVIMQAANTGLTGGSTPDGDDYDRDVVIVSTMRLGTIHLVNEGRQVVCLPGATLFDLEKLLNPIGRNPHSVLGSSCIGSSVFGGICNNSGGALIRRGPAYTQATLFARVNEAGKVELVNHLGIRLGNDPETMLANVEKGNFRPEDIDDDPSRLCSDHEYQQHVREIGAPTPARFNADPRRLFESSGSAGKVMVLAVRLDTFPKEKRIADFYIGTNDPAELMALRRHVLANFDSLPVQGEYLHRDAFAIAELYGRDMFRWIQHLGTDSLPAMFAVKGRLDGFFERSSFIPHDLSDRVMQAVSGILPRHLPKRLYDYHDRFEHHLMLRMADEGVEEARAYLTTVFPTAQGDFFECTPQEGAKAFLHRFATAGAAIRYRAIHRREVEDIVALDIALPRNGTDWFERLPEDITSKLAHKLYYGHFFCQVFHQDYIVKKGHDPMEVEHAIWKLLDARGAEYPAEHNVGHLYYAKPPLAAHYKALDPCNVFNPGIGHTSRCVHWLAGSQTTTERELRCDA
ncbi:MAG: D-lactate dehydrogenase, partial [Acetobacteraceae bacterium]|nr:D-lactate dehydrogenase [Acetobacteraceae bacterium]